MVTCPTCGDATSIEIAPHLEHARETTTAGAVARWAVRCRDCGASWTLTDLV